MTRKHTLDVTLISVGAALSLIGTSVGVYFGYRAAALPKPRALLSVGLDSRGPYLILATENTDRDFAEAMRIWQ